MCDRISNAEAMVLAVIAEHSLPLSTAPVLVELSQQLAADKIALSRMKLSQTAASYAWCMVWATHSLNVDESTSSSNKKVLAMLVSYFDQELKDVVLEHLGSLEVVKVNAASLEELICNFFKEKYIPWSNLVSIMLDSCNVMRGSKSGLETRIRQNHCKTLLDVDGDSCHHVHNAAKKFAEPFENYLEQLFTDLHTDHLWESDQIMYLKEIAEYMDIPASNPKRFVSHHWLSAYDVGMQTKRLLPVYKVLYYGFMGKEDKALYQDPLQQLYEDYHVSEKAQRRITFVHQDLSKKGMTELGKKRKSRVVKKIWFENQKVDLHLSVYLSVLPILKEYVMVFQESQTLVHKLHDKQLQVFVNFLACFIKPEHLKISPKALSELDLANRTLYSQLYIGKVAENLEAARRKHPDFFEKVTKAYVTCGKYMQVKLPLKSKTLQALSSIDPVVRGHSEAGTQLMKLARILQHLVPPESDITQEIIRYNVDLTLAQYHEGDNMVMWWAHVMSTGKYPALSGVIRGALSIVHGPMVESSFNLMGDIIDPKSSRMNIATLDAIQTAKYAMKSRGMTATMMFKREDEKFGPVDRTLCRNMRSAARRDKAQREERLMEKGRRQVEYGFKKTCASAQESKRTAQQEEKEARFVGEPDLC
ncbi:hypothetical protein JOQ06_018307 [Pogonophryne albipinna]|uniref:HAT C-terminal dimerisation domain-containing protein n=1 Tax=Pogonophryne albipinna TaxID=1090488 RepID=A0AAD6AJ10_9TELE|nr:hypothetical protein JOQ06_018307 [Pogonophryne albipinna]